VVRQAAIKTDVAVMKATGATKADVAEAKSAIILWVVGAIVLAQLVPALACGYWSPRQESNLYPTLRRHVHYPLCYGEDAAIRRSAHAGVVNRPQL
jgi:hypothetical protein